MSVRPLLYLLFLRILSFEKLRLGDKPTKIEHAFIDLKIKYYSKIDQNTDPLTLQKMEHLKESHPEVFRVKKNLG